MSVKNKHVVTEAEEYRVFLDENPDVRFVDGIIVDLCGLIRGKRYPRRDIKKLYGGALALPYTVYLLDVTGYNSDPCGRGFSDGDPDGVCLPVPGTLVRVPWSDEPRAQVLTTMRESDGRGSMVDPRNIAAHVLGRFEELDLHPVVAFELEFYLLDRKRGKRGAPKAPVSPVTGAREVGTQVYGINELDGFSDFFSAVESAARIQKIPVTVASSEFAPGQYEINLSHVDRPLVAADHCALLRNLVKRVAQCHAMEATFMAKPYPSLSGSGMHLHISLLDKDGRNVFDDGTEMGSPALQAALGGLMSAMFDATAIFAPHINALRRFQPNVYVPVSKSWGLNNRSVALRIPLSDGRNRRIEHRMAAADANPYLVLAAVLAGVHRGIVGQLDPGPPATGNACGRIDPGLPVRWHEAIDLMQNSGHLREYLTDDVVELYCATKKAEMDSFHRTISQQEYDWYL